ncbi:MAG: acyl-CoA dehydratase activase [candidate division Zixibacteria bacterium]|nr:acyl-CoA dehydratase activase [candidate division Zixibacteria bacterium]
MNNTNLSFGIDIGSVSVKLVLMEKDEIVREVYRRFHGKPFETLYELLNNEFSDLKERSFHFGLTGIGSKTVKSLLNGRFYSEIGSLARGNRHIVPEVRTVIDMGGEDSKLLIIDERTGTVEDFAMNAQCAAGTGSFLDQQAGRLRISIEEEFGQLALKSKNPPHIAGRCSVFAKTDMIHLQQVATPDYDIVAGLCFAVARNFKSSIARGKNMIKPIAFEGGVAANPGVRRAFTEILDLQPGELVIPPHFNVIGAIGAALLASEDEDTVTSLDTDKLVEYLNNRSVESSGREPLSFDFPENKYYDVTKREYPSDIDGLDVFLGIDVGSLSTNVVLIDKNHNVVARRYLMTEGRPIEAVKRGFKEIGEEVGDRVNVKAAGTTGSGRYLTGDFVGADIVRNEITAQATAAISIDPTVDTIFEIGGQDSKYISIDNRAVIDFEMNNACAAGTGSFLQEQAEKLKINIEKDFEELALSSKSPVGCGERCTVFMESDLVAHQRNGASKNDLLSGLSYSIVSNYLTRVVGDRRVGDHIFFQGGVAWNKAVVAAFEKLTRKKITVPPHHDVTGAIGAAILAIEKSGEPNFTTSFRGFDLYKRHYSVESFTCTDCPNRCEIHEVLIEGEEPLYYGSRCGKYDVHKIKDKELPPNYAKLRQKLLFKKYKDFPKPKRFRGKIGIPLVLLFYDYYVFWSAFFEAAGFQVVSSGLSSSKIVDESLELFSADSCFPLKLVYGHVAKLIKKKVDFIFIPSFIKVSNNAEKDEQGSYICLYSQTIGQSISNRFDFKKAGIKLINSPISLSNDFDKLYSQLKTLASDIELTNREFKIAIKAGASAYSQFIKSMHKEGKDILDNLGPDEKAVVIVSRSYNGYDRRLSMDIPDKIRNLGFKAIPMDFLPLEDSKEEFEFMYWMYGKRILKVAEYVRNHPKLFAVYISSFGCGPDSFITHFFHKQMTGKPYVLLEIDEHSADAGLVTRCEAFIDSLRYYKFTTPITNFNIRNDDFKPFEKTIYIPYMCDHAYVLAAAFERFGLTAKVLDESDALTLEYGKKFTTGKECFPFVVTTGDMIKKIRSDGFDRKRSVFFMPGADGPCRFGLYSQFHRIILDDLGYQDIPIFSPNSNDGYTGFGLNGTEFRKIAWNGLVFLDCLIKLLHHVRPREKQSGVTERLYYHYIQRLIATIKGDGAFNDLAVETARDFANIETLEDYRPVVGVVGEIYLRNNRFTNNHLIERLEKFGLEVRLATFTEWPLYTSYTFRRDSFINRNLKGLLMSNIQILTQQYMEHKVFSAFQKHFDLVEDLSVGRVMQLASRYLPLDIEGEAILTIGKAIEMGTNGVSGIVNAMPFNCMPGTVVTSLSRKLSNDLGKIPWLNISYEGLQDSGEEIRLEAFAEQSIAFSKLHSTQKGKLKSIVK